MTELVILWCFIQKSCCVMKMKAQVKEIVLFFAKMSARNPRDPKGTNICFSFERKRVCAPIYFYTTTYEKHV